MSQVAHQVRAYPGFCSMKRLRVFLLPPEWGGSPPQGYPKHKICQYPFIHLGRERHCENKECCPRTQHNVPCQGLNPDHLIQNGHTNHEATAPPHTCIYKLHMLSNKNDQIGKGQTAVKIEDHH